MHTRRRMRRGGLFHAARVTRLALLAAGTSCAAHAGAVSIAPAGLQAIGTVDPRFQSYNIEMVELTGGRFWKPYPQTMRRRVDKDRYSYRPPIDLGNTRLRKLAVALSPAYLRVSGTWANATFFADTANAPAAPPPGFDAVLSRAQWRGVVDFARANSCGDRHLLCHQPGQPRCGWPLEAGSGATPNRLYAFAERPHRRRRIHERADARGDERSAARI